MATRALQILIVEDHRDSGLALAYLLRRDGHTIHLANCCRDAIQMVDDHRFDLLLCDLSLPDGDGCDLLKEILRRCSIQAIAVSGCAMAQDVQKSLEAGFHAHIKKPYEITAIKKVIDELSARDGSEEVRSEALVDSDRTHKIAPWA